MSEIESEPEVVRERVALDVAGTTELVEDEDLARGALDIRGEEDEGGGSWELLISLQRTVNRFSRRLLRLRAPAAAYLRAKLATSEGTDEVYSKLQEKVESPGFLEKLRESRAATGEPGEGEAEAPPSEAPLGSFDVNDPTFWEPEVPDRDDSALSTSHLQGSGPDKEEWEFVETEDVIDSIATFIAGYVATHPRETVLATSARIVGARAAAARPRQVVRRAEDGRKRESATRLGVGSGSLPRRFLDVRHPHGVHKPVDRADDRGRDVHGGEDYLWHRNDGSGGGGRSCLNDDDGFDDDDDVGTRNRHRRTCNKNSQVHAKGTAKSVIDRLDQGWRPAARGVKTERGPKRRARRGARVQLVG